MIKHAIIVLGPSGVGKSSIVNLLTKENKCRVSNKMLTDGTFVNDIKAIQFPAIENSFIIDTPGLGSCNVEREFMGKLREILLKEQISTVSFLLMLFDDQRVPKAGVDAINYMKFVADITYDPSFGLLVRKKHNTLGAPSNPENRADFAMRFPNVKFFDLPADVPLSNNNVQRYKVPLPLVSPLETVAVAVECPVSLAKSTSAVPKKLPSPMLPFTPKQVLGFLATALDARDQDIDMYKRLKSLGDSVYTYHLLQVMMGKKYFSEKMQTEKEGRVSAAFQAKFVRELVTSEKCHVALRLRDVLSDWSDHAVGDLFEVMCAIKQKSGKFVLLIEYLLEREPCNE
jgi:hypothetical protein